MTDSPAYVILGRDHWAKRMHVIIAGENRKVSVIEKTRQCPDENKFAYIARFTAAMIASGAQIAWLCVLPGPHVSLMIQAALETDLHVIVEMLQRLYWARFKKRGAAAMRAAWIVVALCFSSSVQALAEQGLHCADTDTVGFKWDDEGGQANSAKFFRERWTIEVVSKTERRITRMESEGAGTTVGHQCREVEPDVIVCHTPSESTQWRFYRNTYTRAFLGGPPGGGEDRKIMMAYGTCAGF